MTARIDFDGLIWYYKWAKGATSFPGGQPGKFRKLKRLEPSLGRVAVLLFYSDRHGVDPHMKGQCNWHLLHLPHQEISLTAAPLAYGKS